MTSPKVHPMLDKQHVMGAAAERDEAFANAVWEALKGDHNDLRKQGIILRAHRTALEASSRQEERLRDNYAGMTVGEAIEATKDNDSLIRDLTFAWAVVQETHPNVAKVINRARAALQPPHAKDAADV